MAQLKPYEERTEPSQSADAIIARLRGELAPLQGAIAMPLNLPPIIGLGTTGGFQYVLEALQGQAPAEIAATMRGLIVEANQQPELAGVFSTFSSDTPQIYLDIDRDKAQTLGVEISDIFNALQATLGGYYVNDFNLFGRTWQVNVQAETPYRRSVEDIYQIYVRNKDGSMVPLRVLASARLELGPQLLVRYNNYRAAIINGSPAPGFSSGAALAAMERISSTVLPAGFGFEWTGTALQEKAGRRQDADRARACGAVRLSVPGRALRELEHPDLGAALGDRGRARRHLCGLDRGPDLRRLRPDRPRRADRARRQERAS